MLTIVAVISIMPLMLQRCWYLGVKKLALRGVPKFTHMYSTENSKLGRTPMCRRRSHVFPKQKPFFLNRQNVVAK
jgi:hypothetical protein